MHILPAHTPSIDAACDVLRRGGVVIHPTETCYGIACDLTLPHALAALFSVKKRPLSQPVSALFSSITQAETYLSIDTRARKLIEAYLPGPLTIVVPRRDDAPTLLVTPERIAEQPATVGIRISSHPFAAELVHAYGSPIATTSANLHGAENPYSLDDLCAQFREDPLPDLVLDGGELPRVPASTVVEVIDDNIRILRQGNIYIM